MQHARVVFYTTDDDKRADSAMDFQLRIGERVLDFSEAGGLARETENNFYLGASSEWKNWSQSPEYQSIHTQGVRRADLIANGRVTLAALADKAAHREVFSSSDDWHGAWRLAVTFGSGRTDVLSSLSKSRAPRSEELRLQARSSASETTWNYCDALRVSMPTFRGHSVTREWTDMWFQPEGGPTPRVQLWTRPNFEGDKLDLDVKGNDRSFRQLLPEVCTNSDVADLVCSSGWAGAAQSLTTTGGGQQPVYLIAVDSHAPDSAGKYHRNDVTRCLYVGPNAQIPDLADTSVRTAFGSRVEDWSQDIDSIEVYTRDPGFKNCAVFYQGW